jgi:heat shock protein HslJ
MTRLLLLAPLLAGCAAAPPPAPEAPAAGPAVYDLEGPTWRLASIGGAAVEDDTVIVFGDGKITGQGPCNAFRGAYAREGDSFSIDAIVATKKLCANLEEENRMLDAMLLAQEARVTGGDLVISSNRGPSLSFDARPR